MNYSTVVLSADQKEYQITCEIQTIKVVKVIFQMFAIMEIQYGYVCWMFLEAISAIVIAVRLQYRVFREYPWLKVDMTKVNELKSRYDYVLEKIKMSFYHRIGGFFLTQTTPLLVYAFASLTMVAIYGNYLIIMTGCLLLVDALSRGFYAGIGNLVAEGTKDIIKIKSVFWDVFTLRLFIAGGICFGIWHLSESFVILWIGEDYVMPSVPLFFLIATFFIQMSRTCEFFLVAYGLFKDIWAPIVESMLNLGCSIFLVNFFGLSGIFMGVVISQLIVVIIWKGYFLFSSAFKESSKEYYVGFIKKVALIVISATATELLVRKLDFSPVEGIGSWCLYSSILMLVYVTISLILFYLLDPQSRVMFTRIYNLLTRLVNIIK